MINITQHAATPDQVAAGVMDLPSEERAGLQELLTFEQLPDAGEIIARAERIAEMAKRSLEGRADRAAMIGGAMWLMAPLAAALRASGIEPLFAFSVRETEEVAQPDGSVRKVAVFRHRGFVRAV